MLPDPQHANAPAADRGEANTHHQERGGGPSSVASRLAPGPGAGPRNTLPLIEYVTPDLAAMNPRAQRIALEWYEAGYLEGVQAGRRQHLAEDRAAWARMRETIRQAQSPSFADLCRRRGDHARAEATERLWAERGLAS